jgi:CHAT domain-containing protein
MRNFGTFIATGLLGLALAGCAGSPSKSAGGVAEAAQRAGLAYGYGLIDAGKYRQALAYVQTLDGAASDSDQPPGRRAEIAGIAGYLHHLLGKHGDAVVRLDAALGLLAAAPDRSLEARLLAYRGLAAGALGKTAAAAADFRRSGELAEAAGDPVLAGSAELQLARLEPDRSRRLNRLHAFAGRIDSDHLADGARAGLRLNLLDQLEQWIGEGGTGYGTNQAEGLLESQAEKLLAGRSGAPRDRSQALGVLSGLAERRAQAALALQRIRAAIREAQQAGAADLLLRWESRRGRLLAAGNGDGALEAFRRAAFYAAQVRSDIPVTYRNGKSSYLETLSPIYRGLADMALRGAGREGPSQEALFEAIFGLEKLKQSELEDYFNDRCALDSSLAESTRDPQGLAQMLVGAAPPRAVGNAAAVQLLDARGGTAVFYPVVFADRLELLLIHDGQALRRTVPVTAAELNRKVLELASALRHGKDDRAAGRALYQWLLAPVEADLAGWNIRRISYVPDGALRLLPLAGLHDGKGFVAERYSIITNSGLQSIPPAAAAQGGSGKRALLAGLSRPDGPSLDLLPEAVKQALSSGIAPAESNGSRGPEGAGQAAPRSALVEALSLPEVLGEIQSIQQAVPGQALLNQEFTQQNLEQQLRSGEYGLLHVSTHSYFGRSADDSFIMAYDRNLGVGDIERMLRLEGGKGINPVDLVTFSACETAEGDDRAPLGFSGIAVKAKARNALGALWPIDDRSTKLFMEHFYAALKQSAGADRATALQQAQKAMLADKGTAHPTQWAAFILVGGW